TCSSGINWNQKHNYALWGLFNNVQAYVKDINFDEFTEQETVLRKDKMAEMLALHSQDRSKSIGVIQNLSWNYWTNSQGKKCRDDYIPTEIHRTFKPLRSESKRRG